MTARPRGLIISASRRQDMPASCTAALLAGLEAGQLDWRQPYSGKAQQLRFEPTQVFCLALWSKDLSAMLTPHGRRIIDPLRPCFLFTINDCPELERGRRPSLQERLAQAATIARRYGPGRLMWRFDPIVHYQHPGGRQRDNLASFPLIARRMAELGVERCTTSFMQIYGKVLRREKRLPYRFVDPPLERKRAILCAMAEQAAALGMRIELCCQPELLGCHPAVQQAHCIDGPRLVELLGAGRPAPDLSAHPSRAGCGCTRSIDVGSYRGCPHRCAYCYANPALD